MIEHVKQTKMLALLKHLKLVPWNAPQDVRFPCLFMRVKVVYRLKSIRKIKFGVGVAELLLMLLMFIKNILIKIFQKVSKH